MPNAAYRVLAILALLLAALVSGWDPAASPQVRASVHLDAMSIDDDDESHDDDVPESGMSAPDRRDDDDDDDDDADADAAPIAGLAASKHALQTEAPLCVTRWGLRPSGEHRAATDRPPRA